MFLVGTEGLEPTTFAWHPSMGQDVKQKNTLCRMSFVGTEGLEPTTFAQHPSMGQDVNQGVSGLN